MLFLIFLYDDPMQYTLLYINNGQLKTFDYVWLNECNLLDTVNHGDY